MAEEPVRQRSNFDYTIACVCPLGIELAAVEGMMDEIHDPLPTDRAQNVYTLGNIGGHQIVVAVLPEIGTNAAATVVTQLLNDFPSIRFGLLVGVGGGVPGLIDIRLGDVAVSHPTGTFGGVVQFDLGKRVSGGQFERTGLFNKPPQVLTATVRKLDSQHQREGYRLLESLEMMFDKYPSMRKSYAYPQQARDDLFQTSYSHVSGAVCDQCDRKRIIARATRSKQGPQIHYGTIGSANTVLKDASLRDELLQNMNLICVEMEAAGLMDNFPCLVIRGICDYADSHKNKQWQPYAAAVAAAYMRELLLTITAQQVMRMSGMVNTSQIPTNMRTDSIQADDDVIDEDIFASLAFPQMRDRQLDVQAKRSHPNTCRWILDSVPYHEWTARSHGLLWIKGKPGAGKSTLMSFLYNLTNDCSKPGDSIILEFFFSARGVPLQHSMAGMLRSLLNQILRLVPPCRVEIRKQYRNKCAESGSREGAWHWHEQELRSLLQKSIVTASQHRPVLLFVDALDEAGHKSARSIGQYLHELNEHVAAASVPVRMCISSRHYPITSLGWGNEVCVEDHNQSDITTYVNDSFDSICRASRVPDSDYEQWLSLRDLIISRATGVFQWVRLVMEIVDECVQDGETCREVLIRLQSLPEEINDVYQHILVHVIKPGLRPQALLLFEWVCLAEQPLTVAEMRYALVAIDARPYTPSSDSIKCKDTRGFIASNDTMKQRIRALSGGLVEVVQDRVQVAHHTVKEFFLKRGLALMASVSAAADEYTDSSTSSTMTSSDTSAIICQSHSRIYWSCLKYLATEQVFLTDGGPAEWEAMDQQRTKITLDSPLITYAVVNVFIHAEKAKQYRSQSLLSELEVIENAIPSWTSIYRLSHKFDPKYPAEETTPLHIAASAGLDDLAAFLLERQCETPDQIDRDGKTPLHLASGWGHEQIVILLLHVGANVNILTTSSETPLTLAASHGHMQVVQMLLDKGAQLDRGGGEGGNALHAASYHGHEQLVCSLLAFGADVNARGGDYNSALQAAAYAGRKRIVQILIEAGANVNIQGKGKECNALQAASYRGHDAITRLLLQAGANANARGGLYGTPLQAAIANSHKTVVKTLLDAGADVNVAGGSHAFALRAAVMQGDVSMVKWLLEAGADVNMHVRSYGTALHAACELCKEKIVQVLLEAGADVNLRGGQYHTALGAVASRYNPPRRDIHELVKMLLEAGAKPTKAQKLIFRDVLHSNIDLQQTE